MFKYKNFKIFKTLNNLLMIKKIYNIVKTHFFIIKGLSISINIFNKIFTIGDKYG